MWAMLWIGSCAEAPAPDPECSEDERLDAFWDADGDGFGDPDTFEAICVFQPGFVTNGDDCDDTRPDVNPDARETCDFVDNDCDGDVDELLVPERWFLDNDNDGFGNPNLAQTTVTCEPPTGFVRNDEDCDDARADINPAADEVCGNDIDEDCDGLDAECP
ncbi:MAG: putative metal-binding motif-containing protein [Myxococcota bacterium]